jgi:hypothetical protein
MKMRFTHFSAMAITAVALASWSSPAHAGFQATAPTIDGNITDLNSATSFVQAEANHCFNSNEGVYNMRVSHDADYLYIGISSRMPTGAGTRGLWFFIDSKAGGVNTLGTVTGASFGVNNQAGTVLESGFQADYCFFMQNGDSGNRQNYFLNVQDLQADTDSFFGTFNLTTSTFNPATVPSGFQAAVSNSAALVPVDFGTGTNGFEFRIPLSYLGTTASSANTARVFVMSGDGGNGYVSNHVLPAITGVAPSNDIANCIGGSASPLPNFTSGARGAFSSGFPFGGTQSANLQLPVSMSEFAVE